MSDYLFAPRPAPSLSVTQSAARFPVGRIFCVGRNYAAHAAEMGNEVDRDAPFYFMKSPHAVLESGGCLPYPPGTTDLHHEVELVVAIGGDASGIATGDAGKVIFGYGCGLDMTRRDLQARAKSRRYPWDVAKDFEGAAVLAPLTSQAMFGPLASQRIYLKKNGAICQEAVLSDMIWSVPELIADLSRLYHLKAGDLIMTGTPAGVGATVPGDRLCGRIEGLAPLDIEISGQAS